MKGPANTRASLPLFTKPAPPSPVAHRYGVCKQYALFGWQPFASESRQWFCADHVPAEFWSKTTNAALESGKKP